MISGSSFRTSESIVEVMSILSFEEDTRSGPGKMTGSLEVIPFKFCFEAFGFLRCFLDFEVIGIGRGYGSDEDDCSGWRVSDHTGTGLDLKSRQ